MSQKYIKSQNKNSHNAKSCGKYYAKPVYDEKFVETDEIADFIQTQAMRRLLEELHGRYPHTPFMQGLPCKFFFVIPRPC